ncbi:MAG: SUMF1/EgtB/PvdO family nonheme iron enzyme [Spirochaetaceae bacterium]|jgi:formylglycine-generating enzyme required for sulfatase activity|nr:SUMF1/EgtB/PvdO family nonheme iron enzyme [Spirochaetaceae bacterium]
MTFQDILNQLIQERGTAVLESPRMCKALLGDYGKGRFKREIRLLLQSLTAGHHRKLLAPSADTETQRALARSLEDEFGAAREPAEETIRALAQCLGRPHPEADRLIRSGAGGNYRAQYKAGAVLFALKRYKEAAEYFEKAARQCIDLCGTGHPPAPGIVRPVFVKIKGGTFSMGSPETEPERSPDEIPHKVSVPEFFLGKYPVTQEEYQAVMGTNPSAFKGDDRPVENITWFDAAAYCNALSFREGLTPAYRILGDQVAWDPGADGYRLPTEAEWEYACRAGTTSAFHTGTGITLKEANYDGRHPYQKGKPDICRGRTTAAGSFPPNPWGLYDMHGNIWEWCWDWYREYDLGTGTGPTWGTKRVLRGGSWKSEGRFLRSAYRNSGLPSHCSDQIGFRILSASVLGSLASF